MSKVNFVERHQESLSLILSRLDTRFAMGQLAALSSLITEYDAVDYKSAGLSSRLPERWQDEDCARERILEFHRSRRARRPTAAYIIRHARKKEPLGLMAFVRTDKEPLIRDNRVRKLTSWYNLTRLPNEGKISAWDDVVLTGGLAVAKAAGLQRVEVQVSPEGVNKAHSLTIVEHELELEKHGFTKSEQGTNITEGEVFSGTIWSREI